MSGVADLWPKEMLDRHQKKELQLRAYFFEYKCRRCIGTKWQKSKECAKLDGYAGYGCQQMDKFVRDNMKEENQESLRHALGLLGSYKEARKDGEI